MSKTNLTFTEADVWELRTRRLRDVVARLQRTLGKRKRTIARLRSEKAEVIDVLKAKINKLADVVLDNVTLTPAQGFTAVLPDYDKVVGGLPSAPSIDDIRDEIRRLRSEVYNLATQQQQPFVMNNLT